jgi:uncharacterized protein
MITVKNIVLDVLKPHKPNILEFGKVICADKSIDDAEISVYAVDEKTESIKIILTGKSIDFEKIRKLIEGQGGVIHSMDKVLLGRKTHELEAVSEQLFKH